MTLKSIFRKKALRLENKIPVFSKRDAFVKNYDLISKDHLKHYKITRKNPFIEEDHWLEIESATAKMVSKKLEKKNLKILDIGVGLGRLLEYFSMHERYGLDISIEYLKHARSKNINVCMAKVEDMPYKKNTFDCVLCTDVLEHVCDLNLAIKKILYVLKRNGLLAIRVPYREDLSEYLKPHYKYNYAHLRSFDENSVLLLFNKIFNMKLLDTNLTGYQGGQFKGILQSNILLRKITYKILFFLKSINKSIYKKVSHIICKPVEINFLFKKINKN
jgi:ubiquinone/menaquinone biosynthesis C-methylase UbiE